MRLLILTQVVDERDPVLGFFVRWIEELSHRYESLEVICLREGKHAFSQNVRVHSLGKESGASRLKCVIRFYTYVWKLRKDYDAVFVHMNQEYVLLAGLLWNILRKPVYMWRNHYAGSFLTDIAASFCTKVFCTSRYSYTATYKKSVLMPVGVDTERFHADTNVLREPRSILFLSRISPSKRPDLFIEALGILIQKGISFIASVYGSPLPADLVYYESLKARAEALGLLDRVRFYPGVSKEKAPDIFRSHEIFVNCSPSGMFDKTLFEATASGCLVLASSADFEKETDSELYFRDAVSLAQKLQTILIGAHDMRGMLLHTLREATHRNALPILIKKLTQEIIV
jgi:glycosyltransferase involved in cell wall biosynthesis